MAVKRDDLAREKDGNDFGDGVSWTRGPLLGKGAFGRVYKATLRDGRSENSCLPPELAVKSAEVSYSDTLQKEKQIMILMAACSNIVRCYGDEVTQGDSATTAYNLLLEYAAGGTLADRIDNLGSRGLPIIEVKMHTRSLLRGLYHIHGSGYVHCDLKPSNILLVPRNRKFRATSTEFTAKIGDFGLAKRAKRSNCKKRKLGEEVCRWRGTPMYLSPEAVTGDEQEAVSDIWALGCVVLQMLTGKAPWEGRSAEEILETIGSGLDIPKVPSKVPKDARHFLRCCFERNPLYRLTAELLLEHPFLDGLGSDFDYYVDEFDDSESVLLDSGSDVDDSSCSDESSESFSCGHEEDADGSDDEQPSCSEFENDVPSRGEWGYKRHCPVGNFKKSSFHAVNVMRLLVN
ncbi:mitogen-activated protein kinase kinase kinase 20 [Striga hermonthica]|uniref:Mitogen-activated protein kinase kinase kinase 20 n=1 Tax=Striga hermonthica TaxID=68872 RepID=A0A9N7NEF3_STRHE|nr:mitogen-activated protein kinase kinase kinase 20 [Striga hermonthica]